jgi:DNA-binding transcriptional ArsR family regulator
VGELCKEIGIPRQTLRYHIETLEDFGVVEQYRQDRHKRFLSTGLVEKLAERRGRETMKFKTRLLKLLTADSVNPTIIRTRSSSILIRIRHGEESAVLEAFTNPFVSALDSRQSQGSYKTKK